MGKGTFWNLELKEGKVVARELGRNGLVLSGFSITALAFLLNLYQGRFLSDLLVAKLLIVSLTLYFIVSEIARNAVYYWEYALADAFYIVASVTLFSAMAYVVYSFQVGAEVFVLLCTLIGGLVVFLAYSSYGLSRMYKQDLRNR
jgi:hypothetical protein